MLFLLPFRFGIRRKSGPLPMQLVVLSAVRAAVSMLTANWIIVFQVCLFFIVI